MPLYKLGDHAVTVPAEGRYWIAPTAVVIGQVAIEEEVGIWFGAVIRGDNEPIHIGARSNIQENCILHVDPGFLFQFTAYGAIERFACFYKPTRQCPHLLKRFILPFD